MKRFSSLLLSAIALFSSQNCETYVSAEPIPLAARAAPKVDLGYAIYQGAYDSASKTNSFKGIRYAAPPLGNLRWRAPQAPATNRSETFPATSDPKNCPQTGASSETPTAYGFISGIGDEDCLFLNVFAPANAKNLPVFFWIHGGGYGLFSASGLDPTEMMTTNGNNFVSVVIQYRLGAFGFLSGSDVKADGALNAGLLDMNFALQWVQKYISKFGGDPSRVTIAGESAGGAAVLYQAVAYGGKQNKSLFNNIITASPWIPNQYNFDDPVPTKAYDDFAEAAGCGGAADTLKCLRDADTVVVQNASFKVSEAGPWGTFAFTPVTDGSFVKQRVTQALIAKTIQGKRILSGNMANEGIPLSPNTRNTLQGFRDYIDTTFPGFSSANKAALENEYSYDGDDQDTNPSNPLYETYGSSGPTAVNQSGFATGQQQRLFDVFAEYAFDCPSYWAASAFPQAWKYQYSVPPAYHGFDLSAYWSKGQVVPGKGFIHAFQKIWGTFITANTPVISVVDAKGNMPNATVPVGYGGNINWPQWTGSKKYMMSLNTTGGTPLLKDPTPDLHYYVYLEPGVTNSFKLVNGETWEGGRGARCDWWQSVSSIVPY
ncbi:alpha/beta-hydrolase [Lindgomyces ingoldianus]|uniref:Alpha/beta-hydrolase n=1 Tax=Lindgomyces ingoldianus TaxID=673940 RepID=A0ACB6QZC7_9PLEO|nr:alpha/beta-hydrolase [Lindgomyces ingoldianus]KAF2471425.1 alpha/beta-hydrolase [Lindgomyces ingoldianus]